jgi:hypothetical protein
MEKGGGIGACGVEMMQVDYISVENLKYITSYVGTSLLSVYTNAG